MAPKSPKRTTPKIVARRAETPRSERARRREDERDADEDDDAMKLKKKSPRIFDFRALTLSALRS